MEQTYDLTNLPRFRVGEQITVNGVPLEIVAIDGLQLVLRVNTGEKLVHALSGLVKRLSHIYADQEQAQ